jgi:hypothetical protein
MLGREYRHALRKERGEVITFYLTDRPSRSAEEESPMLDNPGY